MSLRSRIFTLKFVRKNNIYKQIPLLPKKFLLTFPVAAVAIVGGDVVVRQ